MRRTLSFVLCGATGREHDSASCSRTDSSGDSDSARGRDFWGEHFFRPLFPDLSPSTESARRATLYGASRHSRGEWADSGTSYKQSKLEPGEWRGRVNAANALTISRSSITLRRPTFCIRRRHR